MTTQTEALKLALEALESSNKLINGTGTKFGLEGAMDGYYSGCFDVEGNNKLLNKAITAIKEALAQPEQEPVAWMYQDKSTHQVSFQKHMKAFVDHSKTSEVPLYGKPLANHELQCVCGAVWCGDEMVHLPNKTPPQPKQDKERCVGCEACIDTACGRDECPKGWPKAAQPEQEPVARVVEHGATVKLEWASADAAHNAKVGNLYTNPPQRTWVGLTDKEAHELWESTDSDDDWELMKRTEAKLKEKNT